MAKTKLEARRRRQARIRKKIRGTPERPRLAVFRSNRHIYAQVIDDENNRVLATASTRSGGLQEGLAALSKVDRASRVGALVAELCKQRGIERLVFDRRGYKYHGRVKALAEAARKQGMVF